MVCSHTCSSSRSRIIDINLYVLALRVGLVLSQIAIDNMGQKATVLFSSSAYCFLSTLSFPPPTGSVTTGRINEITVSCANSSRSERTATIMSESDFIKEHRLGSKKAMLVYWVKK